MRIPLALFAALFLLTPAMAHDSWISRGGLRNPAGEWCCGAGDCAIMDPDTVAVLSQGYRAHGGATLFGGAASGNRRIMIDEMVPFPEAQPSPDGAYWRCQRPDGTRRCFFAPPPNT